MQSPQMGRKEEDGNICEMCMRNQKIKTRKVSKGNIGLVIVKILISLGLYFRMHCGGPEPSVQPAF
eukprot:scaffold1381_cov105-Skeletonema_marinoi.AAC.1